jgi:hypothetical protein
VTLPQTLAIAVVGVAVVAGVLWMSAQLTGQVAERFGEEPRSWQLRMLPFGLFGPFVLWFILSRRGGGGGWA